MAGLGPYVEQMFFLIKEHKKADWSRSVQGVLSLKKSFSANVINLSCKRALAFKVFNYQTIKNICKNGSYQLPVEFQEETYEYA